MNLLNSPVLPRGLRASLASVAVAVLCLLQTGCFQVSRDIDQLRATVLKAAGATAEKRIEVGVGWMTLGLARAGLSMVQLDPRAVLALDALRSADISVCQLARNGNAFSCGSVLNETDSLMTGQNWDRLVTVLDREQLVAIYVPQQSRSSSTDLKVCLVVLNQRQLVIASARSDLEPLLKLGFAESRN